MKKIKIYLDTSVIGGCFDTEFKRYSNHLIKAILKGRAQAVLSTVVLAEVQKAPSDVKGVLDQILDISEVLDIDSEMIALAEMYLKSAIVSRKYQDDALHIAAASVSKTDVLVSWNFKHIVNFKRIHQFNAVNLREGYSMLEIRSPMEVIFDENS